MKDTAVRGTIQDIRQDRIFHICNTILFTIIMFIVIYPLYFIIIASFSDPSDVMNGRVIFYPRNISLIGYSSILKYTRLWRGYLWSIIYTVTGTALAIILTMLLAYALTCQFTGKKFVNLLIVFTMFFSGGLIPSFINIRNLGMYDKPITIIILGSLSVWNTMIARTFIQTSLPQGLYEAAEIDGASHAVYFFKMVLPLSSTIIAVLCVYYAVGKWNDYFTALTYIKDTRYWPMQTILKQILATLTTAGQDIGEMMGGSMEDAVEAMRIANSVKYCAIIVSSLPAIVLYTILQDYFVKGVMIGSIKG